MSDPYLRLENGTVWVDPQSERLSEIEHKLRYSPEALTREDQLVLASVVGCYRQLTTVSPLYRADRTHRAIRSASASRQRSGNP